MYTDQLGIVYPQRSPQDFYDLPTVGMIDTGECRYAVPAHPSLNLELFIDRAPRTPYQAHVVLSGANSSITTAQQGRNAVLVPVERSTMPYQQNAHCLISMFRELADTCNILLIGYASIESHRPSNGLVIGSVAPITLYFWQVQAKLPIVTPIPIGGAGYTLRSASPPNGEERLLELLNRMQLPPPPIASREDLQQMVRNLHALSFCPPPEELIIS